MKLSRLLRTSTAAVLIALTLTGSLPRPAFAEYRILNTAHATQLPDRGGRLGVDLSPETGARIGQTAIASATITEVVAFGAAQRSPLRVGDQIYAVNDVVFANLDDMVRFIKAQQPGARLKVEYFSAADNLKPYYTHLNVGGSPVATTPPAFSSYRPPASSYSAPPPPSANSTDWLWGAAALLAGAVVVCGIVGCGGSDSDSDTSTNSNSRAPNDDWFERQRQRDEEKNRETTLSKGVAPINPFYGEPGWGTQTPR